MQKVVRHKVDRWRQVCSDATLAKVHGASLRLTALSKIHKAIRFSPLCFALCQGRRRADMILTTELLMEKSRMWPDRPLAMIKLDMKKAFDQLYRSKVAPALDAAGVAPEVALGLMRQVAGPKVMPVEGGRCCQEVPMERGMRQGRSHWISSCSCFASAWAADPKWSDQKLCVDIGGKPLVAWGCADDLFSWQPGSPGS